MSKAFWSQLCRQLFNAAPRETRRRREHASAECAFVSESLESRMLLSAAVLGSTQSQFIASDTMTGFTVDAGSNRVLIVSVGDPLATNVTNVTFDGQAMTEATSRTDTIAVDEIWYLVLPDGAAVTGDIVITSSGGGSKFISATAFEGVDTTNPVEAGPTNQASGTNLGSSRDVTSEVGDLVYDVFDTYKTGTSPAIILPGANQSFLSQQNGLITSSDSANYGTSVEDGASTVTMSWTSTAEAILHLTVNINGLNNAAPTLANPGSITFTEGDSATEIASGLTVSDTDDATLASATVTITNFVSGEDTLDFVNDGSTMGNIAVSSNASGVLSLISAGGLATVSEWQAALRAVTYANTSEAPDTTTRNVSFVVNDGTADSSPSVSTIAVTAVNDAPEIANLPTNPLYFTPGSGTDVYVVNNLVAISDVDTDIAGLTVRIIGYRPEDVLTSTVADPSLQVAFQNGELTITGSGTATTYTEILKGITFSTTSQFASGRTLEFEITDGIGSQTYSRTLGRYAQATGQATVTVYGTPLVDAITVTESAGFITFTVNGEVSIFHSGNVSTINIDGNAGNDRIEIQSLEGASRAVTLNGGDGNDTIRVASSVTNAVSISGGNNNDLLFGGGGDDIIQGDAGNDWLNGGGGSDTLSGEQGNDCYAFENATSTESDILSEQSGEGTDALNFAAITDGLTVDLTADGNNEAIAIMTNRTIAVATGEAINFENVQGGSGSDSITGNAASNVLTGNGGDDSLYGLGGNDQLQGGDGHDFLSGGDGNDYLAGGDLNDTYAFIATQFNQVDTIVEIQGGGGGDTLDFSGATAVTVNLMSDTLTASFAHQIVQSTAGSALQIEKVIGSDFNDHITGNDRKNILSGGDGNDTIIGNDGADMLLGGAGNDLIKGISGLNILIGGTGNDLLLGGSSADILLTGDYSGDILSLGSILSEWGTADNYELRLAHIEGTISGGQNGNSYLNSSTIINDTDKDYSTGGGGVDWFLTDSRRDSITDLAFDEIYTKIDQYGVIV